MSRGARDDDRAGLVDRVPTRTVDDRAPTRSGEVFARGVTLPRGEERERVEFRGRSYFLNGSETRALATVGAFRVVSSDDLNTDQSDRGISRGDWRHLSDQGLVTRESVTDGHGVRHVVALTRDGKDLLDAHSTTRPDGRRPHPLRNVSGGYAVLSSDARTVAGTSTATNRSAENR